MEEEENNLELWGSLEKSDPQYVSKMKHGAKLSTLNATWQHREATKLWGPYGGKWKLHIKNIKMITVIIPENFTYKTPAYQRNKYMLRGEFQYPGGKFDIVTDWWADEQDGLKKLETTTITKALSRLGSSADLYMKQFDDQEYVETRKKEVLDDKELEKVGLSIKRINAQLWETNFKLAIPKIQNEKRRDFYKMKVSKLLASGFFKPEGFDDDKITTSKGVLAAINTILDQQNADAEKAVDESIKDAHNYEQTELTLHKKETEAE